MRAKRYRCQYCKKNVTAGRLKAHGEQHRKDALWAINDQLRTLIRSYGPTFTDDPEVPDLIEGLKTARHFANGNPLFIL